MLRILKRIAGMLPISLQQELKMLLYAWQIRKHQFKSSEPEYQLVDLFVSEGDWVLDIGANVGHYTLKFSSLVGKSGRVFALEPVPATFQLLAANLRFFQFQNVTLLNLAATDNPSVVGMQMPVSEKGQRNYYEAHLCNKKTGLDVFCVPIDTIPFPQAIRLIKIDVEGHELSVLHGMSELLRRDHPCLVIETNAQPVLALLKGYGYSVKKVPNSPNYIFLYSDQVDKSLDSKIASFCKE